jgi:hypothetical protein
LSKPRRRARIPRSIQPGAQRASREGETLACLVLGRNGREWFGVDLASGAFVRVENTAPPALPRPGTYAVVAITIASSDDPFDPTRPELVHAEREAKGLGLVTGRRVRRLLRLLEARDQPGATIVASRGPSIAYVDLDGTAASLVLIRAKNAELEVINANEAILLGITFGGVRQRLPIADERALQAARRVAPRSLSGANLTREIGFIPSHVLVGLGEVREGHVPKVVFALLARPKK